jgi:hypothetical protein
MSETFNVQNGVRQGSVISPKIFAIYVDDLSIQLKETHIGCTLGGECFNHLFYADDLCLLAPSAIGLQKLLNLCHAYGTTHDILYNPLKSMCIVFKPPRFKLKCPPVSLGQEQVEFRDGVKYLGVWLSADCTDNEEVCKQTRLLYARANSVLRKFALCSLPVKISMFQSYCTSLYCSQLWSYCNKQVLNKMRIAYNNAYRFLLGFRKSDSASNMLVTHNIPSFEALLRRNVFNFKNRTETAPNNLVKTISHDLTVHSGAMYKRWSSLLFV